MRIAILFLAMSAAVSLLAIAHAQEAQGSISGRILINGVVDRNNSYGILVLPAEILQPLDTFQFGPDLIHVGGEFTVSGLEDREYLVILASTHIDPYFPEETVRFTNETVLPAVPNAPRKFTRAAVRVTIENGRADREVVFELESPVAQDEGTAAGGLPTTGIRPETGRSTPLYLLAGLATLGLLSFAAGLGLTLRNAPQHAPLGRLDEATAARKPVLRWRKE